MARPKGTPKQGGRKKGTPNKVTKDVKATFLDVFTELQDDKEANLEAWGKENKTEFYKLCGKLIPTAIDATVKVVKLGKDLEDEEYVDK